MKVFISLLTIVSMSLLISCSNSDSTVSRGPQMEGATFDNYEMAIATAPTSSRSTDMKNRSSISEDSRIQIWGNISLQVQNISKAMKQIEDLVNQYDARVTSSESGDSYNINTMPELHPPNQVTLTTNMHVYLFWYPKNRSRN